jgi:hypothetical protein
MTDLQRLCFYALHDMTLVELNEKYFAEGGIGYLKRLISGEVEPIEMIVKRFEKRFEKKYHDKVEEYKKIANSLSKGW